MSVTVAPTERGDAARPGTSPRERGPLGGLRRAMARIPRACLACAAIAFANGALWGLVTPPFQPPDEIAHVSYVQYVGERGKLPVEHRNSPSNVSPELGTAAALLPWSVQSRPRWTPPTPPVSRQLAHLSKQQVTTPNTVVSNAPLYYVLEAIPYRIARSVSFFDRLYVLRLFSALLAAVTVAFVFLFIREVVPRPPWAAVLGALAVAFQPVFGFMSGGVNNDNLLYTLGAVLLYLTARLLRRGLTVGLGVAMGAVALAGMLTKTSFAGLLPGAALAGAVMLWRGASPPRRRAAVAAVLGLATLGVGFAVWLYVNQHVFGRSGSTTAGFNAPSVTKELTVRGQLSYLWQVFLPALPGMQRFASLNGNYPLWDTYIQGFVGRFGWFFFGFPAWVNWLGLGVYVTILGLAGAGLARVRGILRRGRWAELVCYLAMAGGYVLLVEIAAYRYQADTLVAFEQTRYLLPLLGFYGLVVAVAARGAGRRWGPAVAAALAVLAVIHSLSAMLLVVGHYYA